MLPTIYCMNIYGYFRQHISSEINQHVLQSMVNKSRLGRIKDVELHCVVLNVDLALTLESSRNLANDKAKTPNYQNAANHVMLVDKQVSHIVSMKSQY